METSATTTFPVRTQRRIDVATIFVFVLVAGAVLAEVLLIAGLS